MKPPCSIRHWLSFRAASLCLGIALTAAVFPAAANTNSPAARTGDPAVVAEAPRKSEFAMPRDKNAGRDPFNPNSAYPHESSQSNAGTTKPVAAVAVDLKLTAIGGTPEKRLCTINGRTFAKGEEGEMTTSAGRVQIHILEIMESAVVLTVNGEQREIRFRRLF
jgi:hypothetical protein